MSRNLIRRSVVLSCVVTLIATVEAVASPGLVSFTPDEVFFSEYYCVGYRFHVNATISIDALGIYDDDGLNQPHLVGLWDSSENLLASVTVANGDPHVGTFTYHSVGSLITLNAGSDYYLAGETHSDNWPYLAHDIVFDPALSYVSSHFTSFQFTTFGFPDRIADDRQYMMVNLNIVPEPSSSVLFIIALAALMAARRRRWQPG